METLRLKVDKKILNKILEMLKQFKPEDLQVIVEEPPEIKKLRERFDELNTADAKFISLEELDANLEKTISKYETKDS